MSKHNGYMIGKQRLSQLTRPRLIALAVRLDGERADYLRDAKNANDALDAANNLLQAAVEAGENIRGDRDQEREYSAHWKNEAEVARGHVATQSTLIDNLETDLSKARASVLALEVGRETLKRFCVNFTFCCTIGGLLAGATVAWLGAWAAFQ